jgi:hypothetical protein
MKTSESKRHEQKRTTKSMKERYAELDGISDEIEKNPRYTRRNRKRRKDFWAEAAQENMLALFPRDPNMKLNVASIVVDRSITTLIHTSLPNPS